MNGLANFNAVHVGVTVALQLIGAAIVALSKAAWPWYLLIGGVALLATTLANPWIISRMPLPTGHSSPKSSRPDTAHERIDVEPFTKIDSAQRDWDAGLNLTNKDYRSKSIDIVLESLDNAETSATTPWFIKRSLLLAPNGTATVNIARGDSYTLRADGRWRWVGSDDSDDTEDLFVSDGYFIHFSGDERVRFSGPPIRATISLWFTDHDAPFGTYTFEIAMNIDGPVYLPVITLT